MWEGPGSPVAVDKAIKGFVGGVLPTMGGGVSLHARLRFCLSFLDNEG